MDKLHAMYKNYFRVLYRIVNNRVIKLSFKVFIFIVSMTYLTILLHDNILDIASLVKNNFSTILSYVFFFSILYVFLLLALAKAWKNILEVIDEKNYPNIFIYIYLHSSMFKYIPGNIFHYINRQFALQKYKVSHKTILFASILEALLLVIIALSYSVIGYYLYSVSFKLKYFYISIVFFSIFIYTMLKIKRDLIQIKTVKKVFLFYSIYILGNALLCFFFINIVSHEKISFLWCLPIYTMSWLAGFVIPGAPAGIGVREGVFIYFSKFNNTLDASEIILTILLIRLTSTLTEIYAYIYSIHKISINPDH